MAGQLFASVIDSADENTSIAERVPPEESSIIIDETLSFILSDSDEGRREIKHGSSGVIIPDSDDEVSSRESLLKVPINARKVRRRMDSSNDDYYEESDENKENQHSLSNIRDSTDRRSKSLRERSSGIVKSEVLSESDDDQETNEIFDNSTDELLSQIHKLNEDLKRSKYIYETAKLELLPDKGQKLRESIMTIERKIKILEKKIQDKLTLEESTTADRRQDTASFTKPQVKREIELSDEDYDPQKEEPVQDEPFFLAKPTARTDVENFGKKAQQTFETQQALTMERLETLHGSLISQPTEKDLAEDPKGLKVELMQHQKYALSWLMWREQNNPPGGILADDMGLGKTLTMISLILASNQLQGDNDDDSDDDTSEMVRKIKKLKYKGGTLIVCPASLMQQWDGEITSKLKKHTIEILLFHGTNRESKARRIARVDVVLTTYDTLASEMKKDSPIYQILWQRVILDEAHVIRNSKSRKCEAVCQLAAKKRWVLTGTPIQNKAEDIYALMKFLRCSPFDDIRVWKRWVDNKNEAGTKRLATVLKSIMLRRTKSELQAAGKMESMPEKFIETHNIELMAKERIIYQKMLLYSQTLFAQFLHQQAEKKHMNELYGGSYDRPYAKKETQFNKAQRKLLQMHKTDIKSHEILVLLLRLRQTCCHPVLIKTMLDREDLQSNAVEMEGEDQTDDLLTQMGNMTIAEEDLNESLGVDEAVKENVLTSDNPLFKENYVSSKLKAAIDIVKDVIAKEEKIVVISQWTSCLKLMAKHLGDVPDCTYDYFTGEVPVKKRQAVIEGFNKRLRGPNVLLLSLNAGGVGLNLTGANHLLVLDVHWNPQLELQAHDRVYRFGQDKQVFVHRLLCKDTIEERIQNLQNKKLEVADNLLHGKKISSKLTIDDLKMLFSV